MLPPGSSFQIICDHKGEPSSCASIIANNCYIAIDCETWENPVHWITVLEPPIERLKAMLITRLTPPLAGMPLGQSLRLLWANEFDIDPINFPKLALHFVCSSLTSMMKRREERLYPVAVNVEIPPPVFVLGHYRSGTTLLHNLLAVDRRFAFPTMVRNYNPYTFRVFEPFAAPLVARVLPQRRIVAVPWFHFLAARGTIRALPELPRRIGRRGPALAGRGALVHAEVDPCRRPALDLEVAAAHGPHPAVAGTVSEGPVRSCLSRAVHRVPVEFEIVCGRVRHGRAAAPGR